VTLRLAEAEPVPSSRVTPILRTALALLTVQGLTWTTSVVGVLVVPRFLGPDRLGFLVTAATTAATASIVAGFGTSTHLVKAVARDPSQAASLVVHAIVLRLVLWAACSMVAVAVVLSVVDDQTAHLVVFTTLMGALFGLVAGAANAGLQGNQSLGRAAVTTAIIGTFAQAAIVGVLVAGGGVVALVAISATAAGLTMATTLALFWMRLGDHIVPSTRTALGLLLAGGPFLAWELGLQIYGSVDFLLVAALTNAETVGAYAFAYRLAAIPIFAATIVTGAVYPALSSAAVADRTFFRNLLHDSTRIVLLLTIPMSVALMVLAAPVARTLGGGHEFDRSVPIVAILSLHIPLAAIDTVLGTALFALERQRRLAMVAWSAAVLNPVANLAAIPLAVSWFENGAIGAAAVTVATECFMALWICAMLADELDYRRVTLVAGQAVAASVVMAVATRAVLPVAGIAGAVAVGVTVYALSAFATRLVTFSDARQLRAALVHG
jgi:O-antigen/teichoic acid export membrane protein